MEVQLTGFDMLPDDIVLYFLLGVEVVELLRIRQVSSVVHA